MSIRLRAVLAFACVVACACAWAAPNKAPAVTLTAPTKGSSFAAPANITISANASDQDGIVTKVEFYQGTTLVGTRTTLPYSMVWTNVAGGTYSLTATATDNLGASKTSSAVSITVSGPKLLIASPANGATVYGGSAVVTGTFFGNANSTVLIDNGNTTRLAALSSNTYSATVPIYNGTNALRVVASRRDKSSDQASVVITGNTNPLLVFTAPTTAVFDAPANFTSSVDALSPAGSISKVDFYRNGTLLGSANSPPYQVSWSNVAAGSYSMSATATDNNGRTGTVSLPITINGPNSPPVVSLTLPTNGAAFTAPANISLTANASDSDGSITLVEFLKNGIVLGTTNVSPYASIWTNVPAGSYALTARATDNRSGVTTSAPVQVTVSPPNNPPTVALTSPATGTTYVALASIAMAANAADSDGTVTKVDFYQGTTLVGTATTAPYSATWSSVAAGSYTLTAKATDNLGATATSTPVTITVTPNSPPTVTLTAPVSGASYYAPATVKLAATATDSDGSVTKVDFYQGSSLIGTATAAPYAFTWSNVAAGSYSLTAKATDNVGGTSTSAAVTILVNATNFAIVGPADNATINSELITVRGTVQAPSNSGVTVNGVVAAIDGNGNFYANNVPLINGTNTITATLTTPEGQVTTQAITVSSTGPAPIQVIASPTEGLAPLAVTFSVSAQAGITIQKVEVDADGNGNVDQTLLTLDWSTVVTYTGAGSVFAIIKVTDTAGTVYSQAIPIVIMSQARLDQNLRAVWSGMSNALVAGDKTKAMQNLDASAQQRYGPVFDVLLPNMPQIIGSFSDLSSVSLSDDFGEYAVNRMINGENRIFFIYFGRNGDGVWRLGSM